MKGILLFALVSALLSFSQALNVNFAGNVTLSNVDEFKFRSTFASTVNVGIYKGVFFKSIGVGAGNGQANADVLISAAVSSIASAPSTYVSYFSTNAGVTNASDPISGISFSASSSFVATTYLKVEEVDISGKVVADIDLDGLYSFGDSVLNAGLNFQTIANTFDGGFSFNLTAVFSDRIGLLDVVGKPIVTPKSLETLLTLSNWKYVKPENSLVLSIAIGSANLKVDGNTQFSAGVGADGVYFNLGAQASVDGGASDVKVSGLTDLSFTSFGNLALATQIKAKYPSTSSFKLVKVTFPAGAKEIIYDPTIGAGANPPQEGSAAQMGILFVAVLALLF